MFILTVLLWSFFKVGVGELHTPFSLTFTVYNEREIVQIMYFKNEVYVTVTKSFTELDALAISARIICVGFG